MNSARLADKKKRVREAIILYEELLKSGGAKYQDILNLIVLYFNCMDFGYFWAHKVGTDIQAVASSRALELVTLAEIKYGHCDELTYWKTMIPFYGWSEPVPEWSLRGDSEVPYIYLATEDPTEVNIQHIKLLEESLSSLDDSERKRYLAGKVELILSRVDLNGQKPSVI